MLSIFMALGVYFCLDLVDVVAEAVSRGMVVFKLCLPSSPHFVTSGTDYPYLP